MAIVTIGCEFEQHDTCTSEICECKCHGRNVFDPTRHEYLILYSVADEEWVATTSEYPSMSFLSDTPESALLGLTGLIRDTEQGG